MKDGFIKVAAGTLHPQVADVAHNTDEIRARITEANAAGVQLLVLPELCVTGYTCGDLFFSHTLQQAALTALEALRAHTVGLYPVVVVGLPIVWGGKLYNAAAILRDGAVLGIVPKTVLPDYDVFCESRRFAPGNTLPADATVTVGGKEIPFGTRLLFAHDTLPDYVFGVEICEDVWASCPVSDAHCRAGALLIANLSASPEAVGKDGYRRTLITSTSARQVCGYVYASAGPDESTQDLVFSCHHMIAENGVLLAENAPFADASLLISEIDLQHLAGVRSRLTTFTPAAQGYRTVRFTQPMREVTLTRPLDRNPFIPMSADMPARADAILNMQTYGLKKRLAHVHAKTAVLGISGGLDSTLALLVAVRATDLLGYPRSSVLAVTMPCFGTTDRTYQNACALCHQLGVTLREINIRASVTQHFADIEHDPTTHDVTYENSQARERTQILMDIANQTGGLVIGTGDLSELALGWATYSGDHMSMYGVNADVPKTLVRYLVRHIASSSDETLAAILTDVLDTPVSPELLPADADGTIAQKTEDLVGPYELHDFFLWYLVRCGFSPTKIYRLARITFAGEYDDATILKWLRTFVRRFFSQQFKRSCLPDGVKVGSLGLSPRGDWQMPSDATAALWLSELDNLDA